MFLTNLGEKTVHLLNADDVAVEFLCNLLLHCPEQWLHVVLYMSYAHDLYTHGIWSARHL